MGTRCNIKITYGDTIIWIYRHWDGYLAETGRDVFYKLQNSRKENYSMGGKDEASRINIPNFINSFLLDNRYELTTCEHGDIEFLYDFKFNDKSECYQLSLWQRSEDASWDDGLTEEDFQPWATGQTSFYNPFEFTFYERVEKDIQAMEARAEELRKRGSLPDHKSLQFKKVGAQ